MSRLFLVLCFLPLVAAAMPKLVRNAAGTVQLHVAGRPFLMVGGELHNSSSSTLGYFAKALDDAAATGVNTVLAPVSWQQFERTEGQYDFALVDGLLREVRARRLKWVLLWFGAWKNGESSYAPGWVKRDTRRFVRVKDAKGEELETLDPRSEELRKVESRTFAALMRHLKAVDGAAETVVMVQPENEVGVFLPWDAKEAARLYATYINAIAEAGRAEYDLPMFCNAWIVQKPNDPPGVYPNGGPVTRVFAEWKRHAPRIDVLAPDIYLDDFKGVVADYHRADNPLLVPESKVSSGRLFWTLCEHDGLCFAPFGIEDVAGNAEYEAACRLVASLSGEILSAQGTGRMRGIWRQSADEASREMTFGAYRLRVAYEEPQACGAVIWKGGDDFTFLGRGYQVTAVEAATGRTAYVEEIQECEDGKLRRVLNGDEGGNAVFLARGIARRTTVRQESYETAAADSYRPQTFASIHVPAEYRVRFYRRPADDAKPTGAATGPAQGLEALPLGAVRPEGWLRVQLELQRDGLTGHAEELYDDIGKSYWLTGRRLGDEFGGKFDDRFSWERGPYYAKGLVSLALTLDDARLKAKAKRWIDALLASQRANGDFGPKDDNWWANMPALWAIRDWGEATGDARGVPFLLRYFRHQLDRLPAHPLLSDSYWAMARVGDNLEVVLWLRRRTGETWLTALADLLAKQSADWTSYYLRGGTDDRQLGFRNHIVNFMQGLKEPSLARSICSVDGDAGCAAYAAAFDPDGWAFQAHGRPDGMLNGTEPLSGRGACQGTELCATAERILSCQCVLTASAWTGPELPPADDLESVAYNTLPSTLSDDGRGMRYYQILNLPNCTASMNLGFRNNGDGGSVVPGPDAGYGCCRSNFHFAWPKFVQSMWMKGGGGLVAVAYGPCTVSNELVTIVEGGDYPFGDRVTMKFVRTNGKSWPLTLRQPRWCAAKDIVVRLNGKDLRRGALGPICRAWAAGDELELVLPAKTLVEQYGNRAIAVRRGALVYALKLEADVKALPTKPDRAGWPAREYVAKSPWNYALKSDGRTIDATFEPPTDLSGNVFAHGRAVASLRAKAYRTGHRGWGGCRPFGCANEPPPSPLALAQHVAEEETVTLVPLGATQVRIALFPWVK